jgi:hypothetical protein
MSEHLKNFVVGLIAMHIVLAVIVTAIWLGATYPRAVGTVVAVAFLCIPVYGLGYSLRQKWKPTPEGER